MSDLGKGVAVVRFTSGLIFAMSIASAEACPSFGFTSPHLAKFFCEQLDDFNTSPTRSVDGSPRVPADPTDLTQPDVDWMALPIIERAWRSDPAKTLRLIERIRDAGGRPVK